MKPTLELPGFDTLPVQRRLLSLRALVEAMVVINWQYIIEHPDLSSLYEAYEKKRFKVVEGGEVWRDIAGIIANGEGSVTDFVCWRIAELRNEGYDDVFPHIQHTVDTGVIRLSVRVHDVIEDVAATLLGQPKKT